MLGSFATRVLPILVSVLGAPGAAAADVQLPPGTPLDRGLIEGMLAESLAGAEGEVSIRIDEPHLPLANRAAQPITLSVATVRHDPATGRYAARLAATLPDGASSTITVSGSIERVIEVPVLNRAVAVGETVGPEDVGWKRMIEPNRQSDTLLDVDAIVGLEARRPLPAGRAVRARDVKAPLLVQRGEPVSVRYSMAGLEITAVGTVLGSGRLGEVVEVENINSGETRRGVVEGRRKVRIGGLGTQP